MCQQSTKLELRMFMGCYAALLQAGLGLPMMAGLLLCLLMLHGLLCCAAALLQVGLLLFGLGLPLIAGLLLWHNRKRLDEWDFAWKVSADKATSHSVHGMQMLTMSHVWFCTAECAWMSGTLLGR
jgi:hypothetical protein